MKRFILITSLLTVFFTNAQVQKDSLQLKPITFKAGVGVFMPQGELSNYFSTSPFFEASVDFPIFGRDFFGIGVQFVIPSHSNYFLYEDISNNIVETKSTLIFNLMGNLRKQVLETKKHKLELKLGLGVSVLQTDLRNPYYTGQEGQEKYESVSAFLLNPSIEYSIKFKDNTALNISFGGQYSPYKIEGALKEDIGNIALKPKVTYSF